MDVIPQGTNNVDIVAFTLNTQDQTKTVIRHPLALSSRGSTLYFEVASFSNIQ